VLVLATEQKVLAGLQPQNGELRESSSSPLFETMRSCTDPATLS
jgi:hypothetical protein